MKPIIFFLLILSSFAAFAQIQIEGRSFAPVIDNNSELTSLSEGFAMSFGSTRFSYSGAANLCIQNGEIKNCRSDMAHLIITMNGVDSEVTKVVSPATSYCQIFSTGYGPYKIEGHLVTYFVNESLERNSVLFSADGRFHAQDDYHSIFTFSCSQAQGNSAKLKVSDLLQAMGNSIQLFI